MIPFHRAKPEHKNAYEQILFCEPPRGCEYSFANIYLWGKQQIAFIDGCIAYFSHFNGKTLYPFPIGSGDKKAVIEKLLLDAQERGIPCRLTGLTQQDAQDLENWFPGRFQLRNNRDSYDYVYCIDDLADLRGKKYQKKRNHVNRFRTEHPDHQLLRLDGSTLAAAQAFTEEWFRRRMEADPEGDFVLEKLAMEKAFRHFDELGMEGLVLVDEGRVLAVTMGSRLAEDTFDIHFEKALAEVDGAYSTINWGFARHLREKYPTLRYLDREDDMGLEGLRKAKLSYLPCHMVEKHWACCKEDICAD